MPLDTLYNTGTVSVGAGSTTVTGSGTAWNTAGLQAGDDFRANGLTVPIAAINSATSLTLSRPWPGSALSGANYDIRQIDDGVRSLTAANRLRQDLGSGTLTSLAALASGANLAPYWSGAGVMATTPLTAAGRSLVGAADVAAMRALLDLVKTASATDTTAGRVMKAGDFGLGSLAPPALADLNSHTTATGVYAVNGTTVAGTKPPTSTVADVVLVLRPAPNQTTQIYSVPNEGGRTYIRKSDGNSSWAPWSLVFDQRSILGTVSQSGGVPTGAIIERGSNANGEYVRFADGTQICTYSAPAVNATEATGQMFRHTAALSWTYPAAFATTPIVTGGADQTQRWLVFGVPATSAVGYRVLSVLSDASAVSQRLVAIGRWF